MDAAPKVVKKGKDCVRSDNVMMVIGSSVDICHEKEQVCV